ncbi:hypothetical protein [Parendozoicomonas sp. Alg238-R29]|uniref:hypothetical protein n=1 Tax=Parendozoicomonas sp. Alg238-R29 TaxID=2993446 RepID=UPI00248EBC9F|nr:hypothetical protein [Parendozoicomonas sp. Alg238-R29]
MSGLSRISIGRLINSLKSNFTKTPPNQNTGTHKGRSVQKTEGQPKIQRSQSSPNLSSPKKASLKRFQSITPKPNHAVSTQIPKTNPEDRALELRLKLLKLSDVPTHKPEAIDPSKPKNVGDANKAISSAETVEDLIKLWNHINSKEGNNFSFEQRFTLRQRFPGRLNMISKRPGQAKLINEKILKTMIPDLKKRNDIGHQILERRFGEEFPNNAYFKGK